MQILKRLAKLTISLTYWIIQQHGKWLLSLLGKKDQGVCIILYYHTVADGQKGRFARQMDMLLRLGYPISLDEPFTFEPGKRHIAVTFDDAFSLSLSNALPELKKRSIPATVFVPTGCLGRQAPWLKEDRQETEGGVVISEPEMRELSQNDLVSFGSHCINHRPLPDLSHDEAKKEIFKSKFDLETILGKDVKMLSFPHGAFNSLHLTWAKDAGYERAFSITPSLAFGPQDEFVVGRVRVDPTDWPVEFRLKAIGAYRWLAELKRYMELSN